MANWYTADTHFGHENVIGFCNRPFRSAGQMDATMIENLWTKVGADDDLWIVGDFAFGPKSKESGYVESIFGQLPGARKHLVEVRDGPHNQAHTLCHYPMITWNHARREALQLFGHVHGNWKGSRNSVNVGVDVWDFMPVRFEDIARRAKSLPINRHWADVEHNAKEL